MKKKIVIIGGGISGLSAGVYAQINGFDSVILEKNSAVGGECIGWKRKGCYIDGCIHWLTGSNFGELNNMWKRVGALENVKIIEPAYLYKYINGNIEINIYRDLQEFKKELMTVAPSDYEIIDKFINFVECMKGATMPLEPLDQLKIIELMKLGLSMAKVGKYVKKLSKISIGEFAAGCKTDIMRSFLLSYMPQDYALMSFVMSITTFISGDGNYPEGSSLDFSDRIKQKYLSLGGKIVLNAEVCDVAIDKKIVESVTTADGKTYECNYVVPACDADITYHKILKGKYNDLAFEKRYAYKASNPLISNCYFAYSVESNEAKNLPHYTMIECDGFEVCGKEKTIIGVKTYNHLDNGNGLTTLISPLTQDESDFEFWKKLYTRDKKAYDSEKLRIGKLIQDRIVKQFPETKNKITLIDSATPVTYARYLGAYKGAYMAFMLTKKSKQLMHSGKIKGLKNCFMASQWLITPGGLPSALVCGKFAIQRICNLEKQQFVK